MGPVEPEEDEDEIEIDDNGGVMMRSHAVTVRGAGSANIYGNTLQSSPYQYE